MPPLGNQLLLYILFGIFGIILGALLAVLFSGRGKQENEQNQQSPKPAQRHPGEVRVWHEGALSRLMTEIDGKIYSSAKELSNEQRQKLIRLLRDWASWLEVGPQTRPAAAPPGGTLRPAVATESLTSAVVEEPPVVRSKPAPAPRPVAAPPASDTKPTAQASIVAQINDILQEMLDSGSAKAKGIRLMEDARNGVTVWVGLQHFNSIDAVSDPEALTLIRAAVTEWERRTEGKSA